jgi:phosphate ABC transporter phosphate-binding protein
MAPAAAVDPVSIGGAGATFPQPLIEAWADLFYEKSNGPVSVSYGGGGSGAGISQITAGTVNFAGSDAPMSVSEKSAAESTFGTILHIPETMGAIVVIFNLSNSELTGTLNLTADNIAKIFQGNITTWNHAEITANNPGLSATGTIAVVHRSDSSGTTFGFTDFLDRGSTDWVLGTTKTPNWNSIGQGGNGNSGVAGLVKSTPKSVGYVELNYAQSNGLSFANIKNKDGNWIKASNSGVALAAANAVSNLPAGDASWTDVSINWEGGTQTYPIATMTYLLVYKDQSQFTTTNPNNVAVSGALIAFLRWLMTDNAQDLAGPLGYVPLPQEVRDLNTATINSIILPSSANPDTYWKAPTQDTVTLTDTKTATSTTTSVSTTPGFELISLSFLLVSVAIVTAYKRKNMN